MKCALTVTGAAAALLFASGVSAQSVPVADGAMASEHGWPTLEEIGVPLYADLEAYMAGVPPLAGNEFRFVNFASQTDVATLLAWYGEHADGWVVDEAMEMVLPAGTDVDAAMMGESPFVNMLDMSAIGTCVTVPCITMVQVVYRPGG